VWCPYSTLPPIPPTGVGQCYWYLFHINNTRGRRDHLALPPPPPLPTVPRCPVPECSGWARCTGGAGWSGSSPGRESDAGGAGCLRASWGVSGTTARDARGATGEEPANEPERQVKSSKGSCRQLLAQDPRHRPTVTPNGPPDSDHPTHARSRAPERRHL
jgi:hypothetical protein